RGGTQESLGHRPAAARIRRRRSRVLGKPRCARPASRTRPRRAPRGAVDEAALRDADPRRLAALAPDRRAVPRPAARPQRLGPAAAAAAAFRLLHTLALAEDAAADAGAAFVDQGAELSAASAGTSSS